MRAASKKHQERRSKKNHTGKFLKEIGPRSGLYSNQQNPDIQNYLQNQSQQS